MKIVLLLSALALPAIAAPVGQSTIDSQGILTCHNCLFDLISSRHITSMPFEKPRGDDVNFYVFQAGYFQSGTVITPDPGLLPNHNGFGAGSRHLISTVPLPPAALLFGAALLFLALATISRMPIPAGIPEPRNCSVAVSGRHRRRQSLATA